MENFSRKADDMMEKFLQITSTVGNQIRGMNSSIVKMKEEGDDRYKQFNERITNIERKILDMDENRSEVNKGEHVDENQGKTVITGFHSETTESEVMQLLKELMLYAPQSRSHTHSFTSKTMEKETNSSGQGTC